MYINLMFEENKNNYLSYWLLLITFLVAMMIIIGGLTRLTDSGLSITKWDLISGILPPLSQDDWDKYFSLYKQIPEYTLINSSMTLDQFKTIYWWEYIHRLLGRVIGILYLIPLIYFTYKKNVNKKSLINLYLILLIILFQGYIGWYMVSSGLTERTDVSHYRLSLHLTLAFVIFVLLLWNYLKYKNNTETYHSERLPNYLLFFFSLLLLLQISVGALVSGLDAGQIYQTWPLMDENYFPDDSKLKDLLTMKALDTPSILQFIHRNVAYIIVALFFVITTKIFNNRKLLYLKNITILVLIILFYQTILGILTVLSGANIYLASMHQIGSILLVTFTTILIYKNSRI